MTEIDEQLIESVAKAIYRDRNGEGCVRWQHQNALVKSSYRSDARAALAVAAPAILPRAMEAAATILERLPGHAFGDGKWAARELREAIKGLSE